MTPGHKVLKAFNARKYMVVVQDEDEPCYERCDDSEIAGIIEQESGIDKLYQALYKLFGCRRCVDSVEWNEGSRLAAEALQEYEDREWDS